MKIGCGCSTIIIGAALVGMFLVFKAKEDAVGAARGRARAAGAAKQEEVKSRAVSMETDADILDMKFRVCDRDYIRRLYGPKADITGNSTTPKMKKLKDGTFYCHTFTGTDELGRSVKLSTGLRYTPTNETVWTFYDQDALRDYLLNQGAK